METTEFDKLRYIKTNKEGAELTYQGFAYIKKNSKPILIGSVN